MPTRRAPASSAFQAPRALRTGDAVAVVAPSSPVQAELLEEGLAVVEALGLEPITRPDVLARRWFTAGPAHRRRDELAWALSDSRVRAVWLARGGYGLTEILRDLDPAPLVADPKPIIGESDATALGCWAMTAGVGWVHGPMVAGALRPGSPSGHDEASLRAVLLREGGARSAGAPGVRTLVPGQASGTTWGGCLSLLAALAGTDWLPRVAGGVLLLEDTNVKPYQVHRMLVQLRDAGALDDVAAVLLGDFSDCVQGGPQDYTAEEMLQEFFEREAPGVPVTVGWPIGHASAPHLSVPMGAPATLDAPESGRPTFTWDLPGLA